MRRQVCDEAVVDGRPIFRQAGAGREVWCDDLGTRGTGVAICAMGRALDILSTWFLFYSFLSFFGLRNSLQGAWIRGAVKRKTDSCLDMEAFQPYWDVGDFVIALSSGSGR
jgi:hypothetical protein